ncbi:hypothetical protein HZH66_005191 [Vespula vulgaris]|uniref:Uncharacterized protein n=1 Tax=Vespula vulgaris TaxID=7454 RepID=A0A834K9G1_VESVU|nr:hypothetical protein HZH66_005191 [Vespula vulgaris]
MKVGYREINGKVEIAKEEVEDLLNDVRLKWRWRGTEKEIMDEERKSRNMGKWEASRRRSVVSALPICHIRLEVTASIQQQDTGILEHDETFDIDGKSRQGVRRSEVGGRDRWGVCFSHP